MSTRPTCTATRCRRRSTAATDSSRAACSAVAGVARALVVRATPFRRGCTVFNVCVEWKAERVPELSRRRRLLVLAICCLSLFIVGLASTIVNLALPAIRSDLNASVAKLQWTIDAYTLVIASLLMVSGSTADRVGRRRTFQAGLVLFGIGSLLCGFAPTVELLIAFRMLQAVGGSMLNPVAMSIITNTFTDPRERAQAIGVWGGVVGLSM